MSYFFRVYHCCFFYCTFHLLHLASTFFRVCLCMCASAKVIYCYKYLLVSFLSTFSLRFLWRTLVFFSVSVLYFSVLFVVLHFLFRHVCFSIHFQFTQFFVSA